MTLLEVISEVALVVEDLGLGERPELIARALRSWRSNSARVHGNYLIHSFGGREVL